MLTNLNEYHQPSTLSEARQILLSAPEKYLIIAGGTSLVFIKRSNIGGVIDLSGLNYHQIKREAGQLQIGALTNLNQLIKSSACQRLFNGVLCRAAQSLATNSLRNLITIGGNAARLFAWSIMPVALVALRAKIVVTGQGERVVNSEEFFAGQPYKILRPGEIITRIEIPVTPGWVWFTKFSRTATDFALVSLALAIYSQDSRISEARVVAGSIGNLPVRLNKVEELLRNNRIDNKVIKAAQNLAYSEVKPAKDFRTTSDYKKTIVSVLVNRALQAYMNKKVRRPIR